MKTRGENNDNFTWMEIVEIVTMIKQWWHYDQSNLTVGSTMTSVKLFNNSQYLHYIALNDRLNEWWTGKDLEEVALT
jgi:hypothetical protein